jgi:hypothetical protein
MRQRGGAHTTTRPLRCERCNRLGLDPKITVEPGVERRPKDGRHRDHVNVHCSNGHSWWSVHPEAIRRSREGDALGNAGGSQG